MAECPTISDCPHCHGTHIVLYEPFPESLGGKGRWFYVCGLNAEENAPEPLEKPILSRRVATGPPKVWRKFQCHVCEEWIEGWFTKKRVICDKPSCEIERNRRYAEWVTSGRPLQEGKKWYEK